MAVYCNENDCHIEDKGKYLETVANPAPPTPTDDEQRENRAHMYRLIVDPITAHIARLRDLEQTDEITAEIAELQAERAQKITEIKEKYPYAN